MQNHSLLRFEMLLIYGGVKEKAHYALNYITIKKRINDAVSGIVGWVAFA